jgi:hypothetical protein
MMCCSTLDRRGGTGRAVETKILLMLLLVGAIEAVASWRRRFGREVPGRTSSD